eukprot:362980-Chlamydomonas_euryale.AAC.7
MPRRSGGWVEEVGGAARSPRAGTLQDPGRRQAAARAWLGCGASRSARRGVGWRVACERVLASAVDCTRWREAPTPTQRGG